jgi:hypothetical protein
MKKSLLVQSGVFTGTADAMCGAVATGLTAAGTTQADALQLKAGTDLSVIGTAAASTGVKLPAMEISDSHVVHNLGANAVLVYPGFTGGVINALAADAGFSVGAGKQAVFRKTTKTNFVAMLGA